MNIQTLIWGLEDLADRDMQERLWVVGSADEMLLFEEIVCSIFDDSGLAILLDSESPSEKISPKTIEKLKYLDKEIAKVPANLPPIELFNYPSMPEIRRLSREVLKDIRKDSEN